MEGGRVIFISFNQRETKLRPHDREIIGLVDYEYRIVKEFDNEGRIIRVYPFEALKEIDVNPKNEIREKKD